MIRRPKTGRRHWVRTYAGLSVLIGALAGMAGMTPAWARDALKWGPHADVTIKPGDERLIGEFGLFLPLWQDARSLLFSDLRFQLDTDSANEGNFGLGYRRLIGEGWILGGYAYYDRRHTELDNNFNQGTVGVEALSEDWDLRVNGYIAEQGKETISQTVEPGTSGGLSLVGTDVVNLPTGPGVTRRSFERALSGVDFEVGRRLPVQLPFIKKHEIRAFVGGFHYGADDVDDITGPRGRVEMRLDEPFGWRGTRFELGGEVSYDDQRNTDYFVEARLRIPLSKQAAKESGPAFKGVKRRMTNRVRRDPDVVTQSGTDVSIDNTPTSASTPVTDPATGQPLNVFFVAAGGSGDCTKDSPCSVAIAQANPGYGSGDVIIPLSQNGTIVGDIPLNAARQQVIGGGDAGAATLAFSSGDALAVTALGGRATVQGTVTLVDEAVIRGFNIIPASPGIQGTDVQNVTIDDVNIAGGSDFGLQLSGASSATVTNTSVANALDAAIKLDNLSGSFAFTSGSIDSNTTGEAVDIDGGNGNIDIGVPITNSAGRSVLIANRTGGTVNFTGSMTDSGDGIALSNNSGGAIGFSGAVSVDGAAGAGIAIANNAAAIGFAGPTQIDNSATDGIDLSGSTGNITFADVAINGSGADGINLRGATSANGAYTFGNVDITNPGDTGLDLEGANITLSMNSLDINGGATGIDVTAATNPSGDPLTGNIVVTNGGTIQNVTTGVELNNTDGTGTAPSAHLIYGGGSITATTPVDAIGLVSTDAFNQGRYDFSGVTFVGNSNLPARDDLFFVAANATGTGDGSSTGNLANIQTAQTRAGTGLATTFVLVNDGNALDATALANNSFTLMNTQAIDGFGNGNTFTPNQPANVIGDFGGLVIADPTGNGAATITTAGDDVVTVANSNTVTNVLFQGGNSSIGGANFTNLTVTNTGFTGATVDTFDFTAASGAVSIANNDINQAGATLLNLDGGDATLALNRGSGANLAGSGIVVQNTTGGSVTVADATFVNNIGTAVSLTGNTGAVVLTNLDLDHSAAAADAINITGGTGAVTVTANANGIRTSTAGGELIEINGHSTGTVSFDGALSATNGTGLLFNNADGIYNFPGVSGALVLNGGDAGIDIINDSGGIFTFGANTSITNPTGTGFNVVGGTASVTYSGAITQNTMSQAVVAISGGHINNVGESITFDTGTLSSSSTDLAGTGLQFDNADGTYNFNGAETFSGGAGIDIMNDSGGAFTFANAAINTSEGAAFYINSSAPTVNYTGGSITQATAGQKAVEGFNVGASANIDIDVTINASGDGGNAIDIDQNQGAYQFDGAITANTGTGTGINITNNTGTFTFNGGLDIDTTTATGFNAANAAAGGTINVTGATNTVDSTMGGTAVNITNTTIGAGGVTFQTVTANGASANAGVVLNNTGGQFTVAGATNIDARTVAGIDIDGTGNATFAGVTITNRGAEGIDIDGVDGALQFGATAISGAGGATAGIDVAGTSGAVTFNSTVGVNGGGGPGINLQGNSGRMTFTGTTTVTDAGGDGIQLSNNSGIIDFATTNIDVGPNAGTHGIDYVGANAVTNFGTTTITDVGNAANQVGIDLNGATLSATAAYDSVVISGSNTATTSIGVDLTGVIGNQIVNLGEQVAAGLSSSITDLHRGVVIDNAAAVQFTFGDGESATDTGSTIDVNGQAGAFMVDVAGGTLAASSFDFEDVAFGAGDIANLPATAGSAVFVSQTGGTIAVGTHNLSQALDTVTVAAAEALANIGQTFVFVAHDVAGLIDVAGGAVDGFTLQAGQSLNGFDDGNAITFGTLQPANVLGNLGAVGGTVTQNPVAAGNTAVGATAVITATAGNNLIQNTVFDGGASPDALISIVGVANVVTINNVELQNTTAGNAGINLSTNTANVALTDVDLTGTNAGTALQIDAAGSSTAQVSADVNSDLGGTTGTVVSIGTGARDVNLSAANITATNNTGNVIDITGQTGGTISFGNVTINGATGATAIQVTGQGAGSTLNFATVDVGGTTAFNNAAGTAVDIQGTGGAVNFTDLDITAADGDALAVDVQTLSITNTDNDIIANSGQALDLAGTAIAAGGVTFDQVTSNGSGVEGIDIDNITGGDLTVTSVDIDNATTNGVDINNTVGAVAINGGAIDGTTADGINSTNANLTVSGVTFGATTAITGDGVEITNGDANRTVTLNNLTMGAAGDTNDIGGTGVLITSTATAADNTLTVNFTGANAIHSTDTAIVSIDAAFSNVVNLGLGGTLTVESQTAAEPAIEVAGNALDSTVVTGVGAVTVIGNGATGNNRGGILFDRATFDADTSDGIFNDDAVTATGVMQIGQSAAARVAGNGLSFELPSGTLNLTEVDIFNDSGTGLFVDTKTGGPTTFTLTNNVATSDINTTGGAAMFLDPLAANLTFGTVTSSGSGGRGIHLDGVSLAGVGTAVTINSIDIDNSTTEGVLIENSTGNVTITGGDVTGSTLAAFQVGDGAADSGSTGVVSYGGTINNTAGRSVVIQDRAAGAGNVTLSGNIGDTGTGVLIDDNAAGTIALSGTTKTINTGANDAVTVTDNTGATVDFTNGGLNIDTTTGTGLTATGGGTLNITGGVNTIDTTTGRILNLDGISIGASNVTLASLTSTGTVAADAIALNNVDGATFNGGTVSIADTSGAGSDGIAITGGSAATFNFTGATIDNTEGHGINLNGANGAVTFTTVDIDGTSGAGIDVTDNTNAVNINGGTIGGTDDPAGIGVDVNNGSGNVTVAAAITKTTAGDIVEVSGRTGGTVTISGNLSATGGAANGIDVNNNTGGGATTFSGTTKTVNTGANTAVNLATNTGHTIDFTNGGLDIDTTTGIGFNATGGGTVTVQGAGNTINSTTATGANIANTTIGASGVTFQSVSVNGAANGIVLNNSGTGAFTITGTGATAGSGGTIQNTTGSGVLLTNASNISLSNLNIDNTGIHGIQGTSISNLDLTNMQITNAGDANNEHGVSIQNLAGTSGAGTDSVFDDVTFSTTADAGIFVDNTTAIGELTVQGATSFTGTGGQGMLLETNGATAGLTVTIGNTSAQGVDETVTFSGIGAGAAVAMNANTGNITGTVRNSLFNAGASDLPNAIEGSSQGLAGNSTLAVTVTGNNITIPDGLGTGRGGISFNADSAAGIGNAGGTISNNTINSAEVTVFGISVSNIGTGTAANNSWTIDNNTINLTATGVGATTDGIVVEANNPTGSAGISATVTNNSGTVAGASGFTGGIELLAGLAAAPATNTSIVCASVSGNSLAAPNADLGGFTTPGEADIVAASFGANTDLNIAGLAVGPATEAAVDTFLTGANTVDVIVFPNATVGTYNGVATCP